MCRGHIGQHVATLRTSVSWGCARLRASHHSTQPSVEAVMSSWPVFDCSHTTSQTGSLQCSHDTFDMITRIVAMIIRKLDMAVVNLVNS